MFVSTCLVGCIDSKENLVKEFEKGSEMEIVSSKIVRPYTYQDSVNIYMKVLKNYANKEIKELEAYQLISSGTKEKSTLLSINNQHFGKEEYLTQLKDLKEGKYQHTDLQKMSESIERLKKKSTDIIGHVYSVKTPKKEHFYLLSSDQTYIIDKFDVEELATTK